MKHFDVVLRTQISRTLHTSIDGRRHDHGRDLIGNTRGLLLVAGFVGLASSLLAGCVRSGGPATSVPSALTAIEDTAEDAYDQSLASNAPGVEADANELNDAWQSFRPRAQTDGASTNVLDTMDRSITELRSVASNPPGDVELARAANAVSAPMDELFALYEPPVPPAVLELDYLGREVVLDARESDFDGSTTHVNSIEVTFGSIRDELIADGGQQEAADFASSITAMRADIEAGDAGQLETDANVELELVDVMEGVFTEAEGAEGGAEEAD